MGSIEGQEGGGSWGAEGMREWQASLGYDARFSFCFLLFAGGFVYFYGAIPGGRFSRSFIRKGVLVCEGGFEDIMATCLSVLCCCM